MKIVTNARMDEAVGAAGEIVSAAMHDDESVHEEIGLSRREIAAFGFGLITGAQYVAGNFPRREPVVIAFSGLAALRDMLNDVLKEME